jgi:hypothetical protein
MNQLFCTCVTAFVVRVHGREYQGQHMGKHRVLQEATHTVIAFCLTHLTIRTFIRLYLKTPISV